MTFDYSQMAPQIDQVLSTLPYPLEKDDLVQRAQQAGANPQVLGAMRQILPNQTFNSPQDVKKCFSRAQGQQGQTRM